MKSATFLLTILCLAGMAAACGRAIPPPDPTARPVLPTQAASPSPARPTPGPTAAAPAACAPTLDDGVSPSYRPGAPERSSVGQGHVLTGVVRSSAGCEPIAGAVVELWPEYAGQGHPDEARAAVLTGPDGSYRFECDPPEHIHMRISAPGFRTIGQNSYHPDGAPRGTFDIVLAPETP